MYSKATDCAPSFASDLWFPVTKLHADLVELAVCVRILSTDDCIYDVSQRLPVHPFCLCPPQAGLPKSNPVRSVAFISSTSVTEVGAELPTLNDAIIRVRVVSPCLHYTLYDILDNLDCNWTFVAVFETAYLSFRRLHILKGFSFTLKHRRRGRSPRP